MIRLIAQLAEALRRIIKLERAGEREGADDEVRRAWDELLGVPRELVEVTDGPTLAALLRDPAKQRAGAELLAEEARMRTERGDPPHAAVLYRRALELVLEARAADPQPGDDNMVLELSRHLPAGELDARYRDPR